MEIEQEEQDTHSEEGGTVEVTEEAELMPEEEEQDTHTKEGGTVEVTEQAEQMPSCTNEAVDKFEQRSFLPLTCPIFTQCFKKYTLPELKKKVLDGAPIDLSESTNSALEAARDILGNVLDDVFKAQSLTKRKPPIMKSGWMRLADVIPNFEIDEETFKELTFKENLLISKLEDKRATPVGALSLNIQPARGGPLRYQKEKTRADFVYPKFLVHLSSQLDHCGHNGGSRIMAWVDRDFQTLEETRKEFIKLDDMEQEKLYVNAQEEFYYLRHNSVQDIYYSANRARNLICEGSNFLLERYLAVTRFIGTVEVSTIHITGNLCRNIYNCKGPQSGMVFNQKLDVCKIERTIIEKCGLTHRAISLLTLGGRILKQEWNNCDYILQINPAISPICSSPCSNERTPLERDFESDLQMFSLFLDAKTRNKKKIENYLKDYPEIKHHIADYVTTILHLKPENVFEFTAQYFLGFAPQLFPFTEYFDPSTVKDEEDELNFYY